MPDMPHPIYGNPLPVIPAQAGIQTFPLWKPWKKKGYHPDILDSRLRGNDDNLSCLNALNTIPLTLMVFGSNAQHPITNGKGMVRNFLESHLPPTNHMPTQ